MVAPAALHAQIQLTNGLAWPLFNFALATKGNISTHGNSVFSDSWSSHDTNQSQNGLYYQYAGTNGDVATVGGIINVGNRSINGSIYLGPAGALVSTGQVTGIIYSNANIVFPDVSLPTNVNGSPIIWAPAPIKVTGSGKSAVTVYDFTNSGYYFLSDQHDFTVEAGVIATVDVRRTNWNGFSLIINGGTTNSGNLTLYFEAGSIIVPNNLYNITVNRPENFYVFGLPEVTNILITTGTGGPFIGAIYAPEAALTINGGGNGDALYGAAVAQSFQPAASYIFHFDTALKTNGSYAYVIYTPTIVTQPTNVTVTEGQTAVLSVTASNLPPLSYQWFKGAIPLDQQTNSTLVLTNVQTSQSGFYSVLVTNIAGSVASSNAFLTVVPILTVTPLPPNITAQPTNLALLAGGNATLVAGASGDGPFSYQWQHDGTNLPFGIITTVAGNGPNWPMAGSFSGDGGAATNAGLDYPTGLAVDANGNLFIGDYYNQRVRKVDTNGIITTVAGDGLSNYYSEGIAATNASLSYPNCVAFDRHGNLFLHSDNRIRKVDAHGIITTVAGYTGSSSWIYSGDGGPATSAGMSFPSGVMADDLGRLFIAATPDARIRKVDTNGIITLVAGNGLHAYSGDGGVATNAELYNPTSMALDAGGNLLIADALNYRVRKVDVNGIITTIAGNGTTNYAGDGVVATNTGLSLTVLAMGASGDLFISDYASNCVRKLDINGVITTVAGNGTAIYSGDGGVATEAGLNASSGLAVDGTGNLYISDTKNNRVRKVISNQKPTFTLSGVTAADAGNYRVVVTGPGGSVTSSVVTVSVYLPPINFTTSVADGSLLNLQFSGTPNYPYILQAATNLAAPVDWQTILTNPADTNGNWGITVTNQPTAPGFFYRVVGY